jgi:hypothetical protein
VKTPGGLGVNFTRIDQIHLAIGNLARSPIELNYPTFLDL